MSFAGSDPSNRYANCWGVGSVLVCHDCFPQRYAVICRCSCGGLMIN
jgi:hypothetical protein